MKLLIVKDGAEYIVIGREKDYMEFVDSFASKDKAKQCISQMGFLAA